MPASISRPKQNRPFQRIADATAEFFVGQKEYLVETMVQKESEKNRIDVLVSQRLSILETYRHHFDLLAKAVLIYFTATGALGTFIFKKGTEHGTRVFLCLSIAVLAIFAFCVCYVGRKWVIEISSQETAIAVEMHIDPFPFFGAKGVLEVFIGLSLSIGIGVLIYLFFIVI